MISFTKLGNYGRLGNQLFQYAFLRDKAKRLGVQFWCPEWEGDIIFNLGDRDFRATAPDDLKYTYKQSDGAGYSEGVLSIQNNTDIEGFFQSSRYYLDEAEVKRWFDFKDEIKNSSLRKYRELDFSTSVSLSLRLDSDYAAAREFFPLYGPNYYQKSLELYSGQGEVVIFADRLDLAKEYLGGLPGNEKFIYMNGLSAHEQLYLMTVCGRGNVITNSTFAWWGAFLNLCQSAKIVAPLEWSRPGLPIPIRDIYPDDWIKVQSLHPVFDNFHFWRVRHPVATVKRVISRFKSTG